MKEKKEVLPKDWIGCPLEEEFFGWDRKDSKKERKRVEKRDRSKYKKSDIDQTIKNLEIKEEKEGLIKGRVISISSEGAQVQEENGVSYTCFLKGILKHGKDRLKNVIVVGDFVFFEPLNKEQGIIHTIFPRKTVLSRADNLSRRKEQMIASNIDLVIITTSILTPPLKPSLLDRYIIASLRGGMKPVVVVNKIDYLEDTSFKEEEREREKELLEEMKTAYIQAGISMYLVSAKEKETLKELQKEMDGKVSVFSGQSGVGKSSLINALLGSSLKIGGIVSKTSKGSHTTTSSLLLPLEGGGFCIDTPGIKSFGIWDLEKEDIEKYFSEIHDAGMECKFPDCTHTLEVDCNVKRSVEEGKISSLRYESYLALIDGNSTGFVKR